MVNSYKGVGPLERPKLNLEYYYERMAKFQSDIQGIKKF